MFIVLFKVPTWASFLCKGLFLVIVPTYPPYPSLYSPLSLTLTIPSINSDCGLLLAKITCSNLPYLYHLTYQNFDNTDSKMSSSLNLLGSTSPPWSKWDLRAQWVLWWWNWAWLWQWWWIFWRHSWACQIHKNWHHQWGSHWLW